MPVRRFDEVITRAKARRGLPAPVARRLIREGAQLTQEELATELGVDQATVARWEKGDRSPRRESLDLYVALLERLQREVLS